VKTLREELDELREKGLFRSMRLLHGEQSGRVVLDDREVLLLCSNNYLGLADHPVLKEAAIRAVERYGTGSGASRLVSGNMELHEELEARIAAFKGTEAALLFNSGYGANTGIIPAITGRGDVIFSDRLNHASIVDGALLSRARLVRYPHNDVSALARAMVDTETSGRRLIVSDGVFSMDGDLADEIDIHMGTFGKALGSFGAYGAASRDIIDYLVNRARSFIFSTALPPAVASASIAALDLVDSSEGTELRNKLTENSTFFRSALQSSGFNTMGSESQIIPILVGEAGPTMEFSGQLLAEGIFVQGIRPPTVQAGSCRLRCTVMATHTVEDLSWAADVMAKIGKRLGII
jgi:glycine C-acetyltransferase